ncbi:urea ABC transporter permease subunit UrtC [Paenibacillus sacheonensis]|uniref:Urea ABC transporter permease subunit UrtC n=1 Tax=Paenibacillus sacheonensis TaxID=742054 RepID=A0A7X5C4G5_9BACL|nr:urea ABC transporter permease subunit UrtC [Paenibacillus sacheonensis]MBM7569328.1 urea transport system permease protein [Paenibacillus sacheonensis]NBC73320.1 urea ABC transporter permease subunit UrtC [Paenibacillus sacheonensis]
MPIRKLSAQRLWLLAAYVAAAAVLFCAPLVLSDFRLNLLAKFLAYAIVALGLDLIWGYTGILSLGHGVFFGLGGYAMAMYLKMQASGGKLPDFMDWSGLTKLPWFWKPFEFLPFAIAAGILLPAILALILGYFTFRNRIRGVYFTILTQALVIITTTLFIGQQAYTGGTNGLTGYSKLFGYSLGSPETKRWLYWVTVAALIGAYLLCRVLVKSRFGKVLRAIRDGENRVRFIGYNPAIYQMVAFAFSAALAGLAGMLFVLHVGIISPSMMGIVPSIEMVLWVAIGGRGTLVGAVLGAVLLNYAKSTFSESYPNIWIVFMGALFVVVVVFLPKGAAGLFGQLKRLRRRRASNEGADGVRYPAV